MPGKFNPEVTASKYLGLENQMIWNLWILRDMIQHRGITLASLRQESGMSRRTIADLLSGAGIERQTWTPTSFLAKLGQLEDAITAISDRKGGVPEVCCGATGMLKSVISIRDGRYR